MTMAVTEAVARGQKAVLCASTGNTSASAAAYAARAGITCAVLIPQGKIAMGKLAQAVMHGAKIIQIDGNFDDCLELARKLTADFPTISLVNSVNPVSHRGPEDGGVRDRRRARRGARRARAARRQRGQHHRLLEGLHRVPPRRARATGCPACWAPRPQARRRWCSASRSAIPRPSPPRSGSARPRRGPRPSRRSSSPNGRFLAATDEEILAAYHLVARTEGVFVEPASAASIAGLLKSIEDGWVAKGSTVVCTVTGNGLKDPDTALKGMPTVTRDAGRPGRRRRRSSGWSSRSGALVTQTLPAGLTATAVVAASSANLGPGFRQPRPGAEPLRRNRRGDNRIRSARRGRGGGRRAGSAGFRASWWCAPSSTGCRRPASLRPGLNRPLPQRDSALAWARLVGGGGRRRSRRRQRSCRADRIRRRSPKRS